MLSSSLRVRFSLFLPVLLVAAVAFGLVLVLASNAADAGSRPAPPNSCWVEMNGTAPVIHWNQTAVANGYYVFRNSNLVRASGRNISEVVDNRAKPGEHHYAVRAFDENGRGAPRHCGMVAVPGPAVGAAVAAAPAPAPAAPAPAAQAPAPAAPAPAVQAPAAQAPAPQAAANGLPVKPGYCTVSVVRGRPVLNWGVQPQLNYIVWRDGKPIDASEQGRYIDLWASAGEHSYSIAAANFVGAGERRYCGKVTL